MIRYLSGNGTSLMVALALDGEGNAIGSLRFNLEVCCLKRGLKIVNFKFNQTSLGVFLFLFLLFFFLYIYVYLFIFRFIFFN